MGFVLARANLVNFNWKLADGVTLNYLFLKGFDRKGGDIKNFILYLYSLLKRLN
jgi:hypothetical protein